MPVEPYIPKPLDLIGNYATLEKLRQGNQELSLKQQELGQRATDSKSLQDYRNAEAANQKITAFTNLLKTGQHKTAEQMFNSDPDMVQRAGGPIKVDPNMIVKGQNGFVGQWNTESNKFEVLHDPTKALGPIDQQVVDAQAATKAGKLVPPFRDMEEQRNYGLYGKAGPKSNEAKSPDQVLVATAQQKFPNDLEQQNKWIQQQKTNPGGEGDVGAAGLTGEAALSKYPANVAQIAKKVANYEIPLPSGFALRSPYWQQVIQAASSYDQSFDASKYQARQTLRKDFASGKGANAIRSLNTVTQHLDTLESAATELDNAPVQIWNTIKNYGLTGAGDARVTKFNTAATAVANELSTVFKNTGATDQEIKQWRANISSSQSPEQLRQNITTAVELIQGRIEAIDNQWEQTMGKPREIPLLSPKSAKTLKRFGLDTSLEEQQGKTQAAKQAMEAAVNARDAAGSGGGLPPGWSPVK